MQQNWRTQVRIFYYLFCTARILVCGGVEEFKGVILLHIIIFNYHYNLVGDFLARVASTEEQHAQHLHNILKNFRRKTQDLKREK